MTIGIMTPEEVREFLLVRPARLRILATVRADGGPHAAPLWFDVDDDGDLLFNTAVDSVKGRNLRREGRAALSVADPEPPYSFVLVEGRVTIIEDLAQVRPWAGRIGGRYMGEERADEFGDRNGESGELLVRLHSDKVTAAVDLDSY
jgi:hypothetical protein